MPSYVKFREVSAAITAGQHLATAGETLQADVRRTTFDLAANERRVLKGTDSYSQEFMREYEKATEDGPTVNVALRSNSLEVAEFASQIGDNVLTAARSLLWVDAVNGAAMFRTSGG